MIVEASPLEGLWKISLEPLVDERGFFARTFCCEEFASRGLLASFNQISLSRSLKAGTLRGMHYQHPPHAETKVVRCVRGAVFDVVIDLRPDSPTRGRWHAERLSAKTGGALYIPPGFAHGFQTLEDNADVLYQISPTFLPGYGAGVRWNDPVFSIPWPRTEVIISERDASYPDWLP